MATYQVGGAEYEISDNASPQQLEAILKQLASQEKDIQANYGTLDFSTDMAQKLFGKGTEAIGRATGLTGVEQFGSDMVANQDAQMQRGNYQSQYSGSLSDTYSEGGIGSALGWIGEKALENSVSGGVALAGTAAAAITAPFSLTASAVLGGSTLVGSAILGTGEAALEAEGKTGEYDETTAIGTGILIGILDKFGAGKVIPKSKLASMTGEEVVDTLMKAGKVDAARAVGNRIVKAGVAEGVTETAQQGAVMGQAALQGAEYTGKELTDAAIDSFAVGSALGGGARTGIETASGAASGTKAVADKVLGNNSQVTDPEAAADLAQRLKAIATANDYKLDDVSKTSTKGARETVDKAHVQIAEDIKRLSADLKTRLNVKDTDELSVVLDKVLAAAGKRQAKNKTKNTVGQQEMDAIQRLTGNTAEGQKMLSLMRQSNELTELHNSGYVGGVSKYTDMLNPIRTDVGYSNTSAVEIPTRLAGTVYGFGVSPALTAGQLATVGAGRLIDKVTGNRSNVDRFVRQNQGNQGIQQQTAPSLRTQAQQEEQQKQAQAAAEAQRQAAQAEADRQDNLARAQKNAPPNPESPQGTVEDGTGLDRAGVAKVLRILKRTGTPNMRAKYAAYEKSVAEGGRIPDFTVIRDINAFIEANPNYVQRVREPNQQMAAQAMAAQDARIEQGKQDNRTFVQNLRDKANQDNDLNQFDKKVVNDALDNMQLDLGRNPVEAVEQIAQSAETVARNKPKVMSYLTPYVERVTQQQKQPKGEVNQDKDIEPIDFGYDPFEVGEDISLTSVGKMPTDAEFEEMKAGTFKPEKQTKLEDAYGELNELWKRLSGRDEPFEYTPENVERIARMMATEALQAFNRDDSAIGWYDAKLKAAKSIMRLVEPRIDDNEQAFDFALAVTSNGQAVEQNFSYALDVFRKYLDTGRMPEDFAQGGDRNRAMVNSFKFYNTYQNSGATTPLETFLDADFTVRELKNWIDGFNKANGTELQLNSQENMDTTVKGSYILGAKIGQGFYQNLRGNYEPLTMDLWWMRMWNRLVGRPFKAPKSEETMQKNRDIIAREMKSIQDPEMKKLIRTALKKVGATPVRVTKNPVAFDNFIQVLGADYQSFYKQYKKRVGKNHKKPQLFKTVGTHILNLAPELQATPAGGGERAYMREVTNRARELLKARNIDINTADFQALMWYPEKQLAEKMGIQKGKGDDNDYLDAAIIAARKEGINDGQIQEALPQAERDRLFGGTAPRGEDGSLRQVDRRTDEEPTVSQNRDTGNLLDFFDTTDLNEQASDLISKLTAKTAGSKSGQMFRSVDKVLPKAIKRLDPEGREVASLVQAGLDGKRLSNEDIARVMPHLVRYFRTNLQDDSGTLGQYQKGMYSEIAMRPLKDPTMGGGKGFLDTFFHELGHAIEEKSGMRGKVKRLKNILNPNWTPSKEFSDVQKAESEALLDEIIDVSKLRRPNHWNSIDRNMRGWQEKTNSLGLQVQIPSAKQIALMDNLDFERLALRYADAMRNMGHDSDKMQYVVLPMIKEQIDYVYSPAELSADAVAMYMQTPDAMKKNFPVVAEAIREYVNESDIAKFITFHTVAGLLGAGAMTALLQDAADDEEQGILSLGTGALSSAA